MLLYFIFFDAVIYLFLIHHMLYFISSWQIYFLNINIIISWEQVSIYYSLITNTRIFISIVGFPGICSKFMKQTRLHQIAKEGEVVFVYTIWNDTESSQVNIKT
jgi:hypothetical protein